MLKSKPTNPINRVQLCPPFTTKTSHYCYQMTQKTYIEVIHNVESLSSSERPNHYGHGHGSAELGGSVVRPNRQVRSTEPPPNQITTYIRFTLMIAGFWQKVFEKMNEKLKNFFERCQFFFSKVKIPSLPYEF